MKSVTLKSRIVSRSTSLVMSSPAQLRGTLPRPSSGLMPMERLSWVHLQARDLLLVPGSQSPQAWWEPICIPVTHPITSTTGTLCSRTPSTSLLSVSISHYVFLYCYGRYCVRRSVSPQVLENPSGPLVDNFIVLPCVAFGVACVKLLPGVDRWNSLDDPRVIGPCHCKVWGWPRH